MDVKSYRALVELQDDLLHHCMCNTKNPDLKIFLPARILSGLEQHKSEYLLSYFRLSNSDHTPISYIVSFLVQDGSSLPEIVYRDYLYTAIKRYYELTKSWECQNFDNLRTPVFSVTPIPGENGLDKVRHTIALVDAINRGINGVLGEVNSKPL